MRQGHDLDHPPSSSTEVKERVDLFPLWASMVCSRVNLRFNGIMSVPHNSNIQFSLGFSILM